MMGLNKEHSYLIHERKRIYDVKTQETIARNHWETIFDGTDPVENAYDHDFNDRIETSVLERNERTIPYDYKQDNLAVLPLSSKAHYVCPVPLSYRLLFSDIFPLSVPPCAPATNHHHHRPFVCVKFSLLFVLFLLCITYK